MKRISPAAVGALVVALLATVFALPSVAGAAEIPPTAACSAKFETLMVEYERKLSKRATDREEERAARAFFGELVAAGCLTASEPLLEGVPPKPNTPECLDSAGRAGQYWNPLRRALNSIFKEMQRNVIAPRNRMNADFRRRLEKLDRQGASTRRVKQLLRKRRAANGRFDRKAMAFDRKLEKTVGGHAYASTLVLYELVAQRCVGVGTLGAVFNGAAEIPDTPGAQVLAKNRVLIFISVIYASLKAVEGAGSDSGVPKVSASTGPSGLPVSLSEAGRLGLPPLPGL